MSDTSGAEPVIVPLRPSWRERLARRSLGLQFWTGAGILATYLVIALSALVEFRSSLDRLSTNIFLIAPSQPVNPIGPSWAHPFGILPGVGTDLFSAVWQATPWDLAIVAAILTIDAMLGWFLGALAGMNEGGVLDSVIIFVGDTFGAIPSFFLVVALFAGLGAIAPNQVGLPLFVILFGLVIWPATARITRERARLVARQPFLESARASGAGSRRLLFRHVLPNSISPLLAQIPIDVAPIFFVLTVFPWFWDCGSLGAANEAGFPAYLVASLPPYSPLPAVNFPEWGNLLAVGLCEGIPLSTVGNDYLWMFVPQLLAIMLLGIAISFVCDGLDKRLSTV